MGTDGAAAATSEGFTGFTGEEGSDDEGDDSLFSGRDSLLRGAMISEAGFVGEAVVITADVA